MARYREIAADLGARIARGEFAVGSALPAEVLLASEYEVSRGTVRSALASLERRGTVVPRRGSGWVIRSAAQTQAFGELMGFAQWASSRGLRAGGRIVAREADRPTAREARELQVPTTDRGIRLTRLRTLDERVAMLERAFYPSWVSPIVEALPVDVPSIVAALADAGVDVAVGRHVIDAVAATQDDARVLDVRRASPLLRMRHRAAERDGRAVWSSDDRYLPGMIAFEVVATGSSRWVERTLR